MMASAYQRWLAVGLLIAVVATLLIAVVMPLVSMGFDYYEQKNNLMFRLQRQQTIIARKQQVADNLQSLSQQFEEQNYFSSSNTEALASAELQNIVKNAVTDAAGQLTSTQGLPGKQEKDFIQVAVKVRLTGTIETLANVLRSIETAVPVLIIDQLDVSPVRGVRNVKTNKVEPSAQLNISFQVVSYMKGKTHDQ